MSNSLVYSRLYKWYESNRRVLPWRETEDAYAIWLSEIILQQTRVAQGMDYYLRFIARWPKVEDLAAADEAAVLREWQGLGYYSRARNMHKAAQMIVERGWAPFPTRFEDIRSLPGVGDYTAGAIVSFAYNQPFPAMDGNVYRVVARLMDIDEAFDTTAGKKLFHRHIEQLLDTDNPRLFNSSIMEFGALYCTPTLGDNCSSCPLQAHCIAFAHGTAALLPVRKPRPALRNRWFDYHIYIKTQGGNALNSTDEITTLLCRREDPHDIWFHLYEFPCEELSEDPAITQPRSASLHAKPIYTCTHVLSHQRIHARFFIHRVSEFPVINGAFCVSWKELDDFALSRLTLRALDSIYHQ